MSRTSNLTNSKIGRIIAPSSQSKKQFKMNCGEKMLPVEKILEQAHSTTSLARRHCNFDSLLQIVESEYDMHHKNSNANDLDKSNEIESKRMKINVPGFEGYMVQLNNNDDCLQCDESIASECSDIADLSSEMCSDESICSDDDAQNASCERVNTTTCDNVPNMDEVGIRDRILQSQSELTKKQNSYRLQVSNNKVTVNKKVSHAIHSEKSRVKTIMKTRELILGKTGSLSTQVSWNTPLLTRDCTNFERKAFDLLNSPTDTQESQIGDDSPKKRVPDINYTCQMSSYYEYLRCLDNRQKDNCVTGLMVDEDHEKLERKNNVPGIQGDGIANIDEFLFIHLELGMIEGLTWVDRKNGIFAMPWKHKATSNWTNSDAMLYTTYARNRGRDPTKLPSTMMKAVFRCAVNKRYERLRCINKTVPSARSGLDQVRLYQFIYDPVKDPQRWRLVEKMSSKKARQWKISDKAKVNIESA